MLDLLGSSAAVQWPLDPRLIEDVLRTLAGIAPYWLYLVIGLGAAVESFFPPIPADTFALLGAFLSAQGRVTATGVFLVTWSSNVTSALLAYAIARRWGGKVLKTRLGRYLLRRRQLERLAALYAAHGGKIIFASRFLPAFRSLVPVFAGISRLPFWRTALPIAVASGLWYGVLVYAGAMFGRNWHVISGVLDNVNALLAAIAALVAALVVIAWWRTRHHPHAADDATEEEA